MFSADRRYRYMLQRHWIGGYGACMFVGLNPSTADEAQDDPTIRRCINYAKAWGYGSFIMTNLFAIRATDPRVMLRADDPIGQDNDEWLVKSAAAASIVVAAWGAHGGHRQRAMDVCGLLPELHCLRLTKDGHPGHPLYLPGSLKPRPWWSAHAHGPVVAPG